MNREIEFRGKRVDRDEWIYGNLLYENVSDRYYIDLSINIREDDYCKLYVYAVEVIPETIEQYTGLKDKNGKKIFEGDIIKCKLVDIVKKGNKWVNKVTYELYEVIFSIEDLGFKFKDNQGIAWGFRNCELEVIGTIFDKENKE